MRKAIGFLTLLVLCVISMQSQVNVNAVLDTSRMRIGEQVHIDLYMQTDANSKDQKIQWPSVGDTITSKVEVIGVTAIDTTFPDKGNPARMLQHQRITVSVYDSGYFSIPGFSFVIDSDTSKPVITNPLFLEVHTVPTDTSLTKIKDIKAPFDEPFNWKWYLGIIYTVAAILLALAIAILIYYYVKKNRKPVVYEPPKPKIPAHITALSSLEKIREEKVWKEGHVKEYYSQISDTVRLYIEERFGLMALESTTDEIMRAFKGRVVDAVSMEKLSQLLTLSDLVEFAKMTPVESEHDYTLDNAFAFVNGTKQDVVETAIKEEHRTT